MLSLFYCLLLASPPHLSLLVGQLATLTCKGKLCSELRYSKINMMLMKLVKSSQLYLREAAEYGPPLRGLLHYCLAVPPDLPSYQSRGKDMCFGVDVFMAVRTDTQKILRVLIYIQIQKNLG